MYKVFYNQQTIIFTEHIPAVSRHASMPGCLIAGSVNDLQGALESILNPDSSNIIWIKDAGLNVYQRQFLPLYCPVEAAGGYITTVNGEVVSIRRHEMWDLPKGKLDPDETRLECAIREVKEETGLSCSLVTSMPFQTQHIYQLKGIWYLKTTWWFHLYLSGGWTAKPQTSESITEVALKTPDFILKRTSNDTWPLVREVVKHFHKDQFKD